MIIMTSYFSSKAPGERKVCIAKWNRYWSGPRAKLFAPEDPKAKEWEQAYRANLEARFPTAAILQAYLDLVCGNTPDPILCCYEKRPEDCHRGILAAYITSMLGIAVPEWPGKKEGRMEQASLM